uniref:Uncharacterized protein n=1 Tax=Pithovirus LCPAC401 TaxID=2506595 RepID=A0A481ZB03_9VIRU|nr:MAG: hypothetical protein LCPAC401_04540 [Pithovirus LCPAC401]
MSVTNEIMVKVMKSFYNKRGPPCNDREMCVHCVQNLSIEMLELMKTDEEFFNKVKDFVRPKEEE